MGPPFAETKQIFKVAMAIVNGPPPTLPGRTPPRRRYSARGSPPRSRGGAPPLGELRRAC